MRLRCGICGDLLDICEGECQDEITLEEKIDYLRSLERRREDAEINSVNRTARIGKDCSD
jgi:hypothetical protein